MASQQPASAMPPMSEGTGTVNEPTLHAPNRGALWSSLALTKVQLAALCGVTPRQISHWTDRGYLVPTDRERERYNGDAIDLCVLIKQGLAGGLSTRRAVTAARAFLAEESARRPGLATIEPATLLDTREKLRGAAAALAAVLEVVEPLVPAHPEHTPVEAPAIDQA